MSWESIYVWLIGAVAAWLFLGLAAGRLHAAHGRLLPRHRPGAGRPASVPSGAGPDKTG